MLFKLRQEVNCTFVLIPGYTHDEIGPGGRRRLDYEKTGDMVGFSVEMSPYYDTCGDARLMKDPEKKAKIEEMLLNHPGFGKTFSTWDGKDEKMEVTVGEIQAKNERIAALEKQLAEKDLGPIKVGSMGQPQK